MTDEKNAPDLGQLLERVQSWTQRTLAGSEQQAILLEVVAAIASGRAVGPATAQLEASVRSLRTAAHVRYPGPADTDASFMVGAASKINRGFTPGGSNVTNAVVKALRTAADVIEAGAIEELPVPNMIPLLGRVNAWELRAQAGSDRQALLLDIIDALHVQLAAQSRLRRLRTWVATLHTVGEADPTATAADLRLAAAKIHLRLPPGRSTVTNSVVRALRAVAEIIDHEWEVDGGRETNPAGRRTVMEGSHP